MRVISLTNLIILFALMYMIVAIVKCKSITNNYSINTTNANLIQSCQLCYQLSPSIIIAFKYGTDAQKTAVFKNMIGLCVQLFGLPLSQCTSLINEYSFVVEEGLKRTPLNGSELCNYFLGCSLDESPIMLWDLKFPNIPKPPVRKLQQPKPNAPKLKILHIADTHIDNEYKVGSVANCNGILCCRSNSTVTNSNDTIITAGYWGSSNKCDIPLRTVENMFKNILDNEDFDFIIFTGDTAPHDIWNQTQEKDLNEIEATFELFRKYFPHKKVYSALGNHELVPTNLFPTQYTPETNLTWLLTEIASDWTSVGLTSKVIQDISNGAFYSTIVYPGLRLISLNMNFCYNLNFWLYVNSTDPLNQLQWLIDILQHSEINGERVIIIGHHYPGTCLLGFGKNYYKIVNRYENTIAAQFFGHSHSDFFEIFYEIDKKGKAMKRATNVAFVTPSATTFQDDDPFPTQPNPVYRIYTLDGGYQGSTFNVLRFVTKYLDLKLANKDNVTVWKTEYDTNLAYGLKTLFPQDLDKLVQTMMKNLFSKLTETYLRYYFKLGVKDLKFCNLQCRINYVCKLKQARRDNFVPCNY